MFNNFIKNYQRNSLYLNSIISTMLLNYYVYYIILCIINIKLYMKEKINKILIIISVLIPSTQFLKQNTIFNFTPLLLRVVRNQWCLHIGEVC